jgi:hypothetical protein
MQEKPKSYEGRPRGGSPSRFLVEQLEVSTGNVCCAKSYWIVRPDRVWDVGPIWA